MQSERNWRTQRSFLCASSEKGLAVIPRVMEQKAFSLFLFSLSTTVLSFPGVSFLQRCLTKAWRRLRSMNSIHVCVSPLAPECLFLITLSSSIVCQMMRGVVCVDLISFSFCLESLFSFSLILSAQRSHEDEFDVLEHYLGSFVYLPVKYESN